MDRRRFLGFAPSLLAGAVLAKPIDRVSAGREPADVDITLIAPPVTFSAARSAVERAFASDRMPEDVTVRLRSWWSGTADPELPELIRFGDQDGDLERAAAGLVVTVESAADPSVESLLAALPPLRHTLTRVVSVPREGSHWPAETLISAVAEGGAAVVRVPAYWEQQFWWQIAQAPAGDDGSRELRDVEAVRFMVGELLQMEERNVAQVAAAALLCAALAPMRGEMHNAAIAVLRCISDERGLLRTELEVI